MSHRLDKGGDRREGPARGMTDLPGAGGDAAVLAPAAPAFFERVGAGTFRATRFTEGAWSREEQHIAPSLGLLAHAIDLDLKRRRDDALVLARLSCDILGTMPIGEVTIDVNLPRAGRTIELAEARLVQGGRTAVVARAWLLRGFDTAAFEGTAFEPLPPPEAYPPLRFADLWGGACAGSVEVRQQRIAAGRARTWLRNEVELVAGEAVGATAHTLRLVDFANGVAPRLPPETVAFPNVDLTVHLFREPRPGWLGFDTSVSFGAAGLGLTQSVLHDRDGAFGTVAQCLTVRPR